MNSDRPGQVWAYDVDAMRALLEAAFDEAGLRAFCLDRPAFRPVTYLFAPDDDLDTLAGKVTGYCLRTERFDALIDEVKVIAPDRYERVQARLIQPGVIDATTPVAPLRRQVGALLEAGAYGQAIWLLRKAQVGRPQNAQLEGLLAEALYEAGVQAYTAGQWAEAERALAEVAELDAGYRDVGRLLQQVRARLPEPEAGATVAEASGASLAATRTRSRRRGWPLLVLLLLVLLVACAGGLYLIFRPPPAPEAGPVAVEATASELTVLEPTDSRLLVDTTPVTAESAESPAGAADAEASTEGTATADEPGPTQAPEPAGTDLPQATVTPESSPTDAADAAASAIASDELAATPSNTASLAPDASPAPSTATAAATDTATAALPTAAATPSATPLAAPPQAPSGLATADTPALSPVATAVLTGTSGLPQTWQLVEQRLLGPGEAGQICGDGTAQIRARVVDALGNPLGGVWLHDAETGGNQITGSMLGETVFTCGVGGWGQLCITDGDNGPCTGPSTRALPCWDLPPFEDLWAAGYCGCCEVGPSEGRCEQLLRQNKCPRPQPYAWEVTFQRTW